MVCIDIFLPNFCH